MARNDIIVKLRLAGEQFDRDFKVKFQDLEAAAERQSADAGARAGGSFMAGFLGSAGIAGLGTAIGAAINSAANLGTEILDTSRQFNVAAESLQVWRAAASTAGVGADVLNEQLANLTQKIGEAAAGNRQAQQAFVDLGIGFETASGQARATDAVMLDLAKRITEIEDPAERVRLGAQLLGDEFRTIYPLLLNGADGFNRAAQEAARFGGVLTQDELRNLDRLNKDIEEMKNQLSRSVAKVVADNASSISGFAQELTDFAAAAVEATGTWLNFRRTLLQYADNYDPKKDGSVNPNYAMNYRTPEGDEAIRKLMDPGVAAPRVTGGGGASARRTGGARTPTQSAAEREAERAAKEAIRSEEQLRDAIARTLRAQEDSAAVARIRSEQGEEAAARAEAELGFLRQHPLAVNDTVEALAKALGITKALTDTDRQRLQLLIDQGNAAQSAAGDAAAAKVREAQEREAKKQEERNAELARREAERWAAEYERAIFDVANIYETAFRGGTKDLWRNFKDEGTRMIAEIAAQWTLAMIAGQKFDLGAAAGAALGRSPLSSIFFGIGGPAANDNGRFGVPGFGGGTVTLPGGVTVPDWQVMSTKGWGMGGAGLSIAQRAARPASLLESPGFGLALGSLAGSLVGGNSTTGQIGSMLGSIGGQALGASIGAFGGPIGAVVGAVAGKLIGGLLSSTPRGAANLTGANQFTLSGNNKGGAQNTAGTLAGQVSDSLLDIAQRLGGGVGRFAVSIGVSGDSFHVDPTGQGRLKKKQGGIDFNQDQAAAVAFAIADAIKDGAITGISQASQNLLRKGGNLEKQLEKAMMIEQIPKLLRQRLNPLGAALDELYDKFKLVNDALVEGSASAEQIAQARQLWELEKADAIKSIGAASQSLKDFLASLNAGSNSPLSLREQRAEAERQLAPFIAQIDAAETARADVDRLRASGASAAQIAAAEERARTTAAAINQDGFTQASQLLLSISRQAGASSGAFFSDFDRIRALTGQAISFVDQAAATGANTLDPFTRQTAQNTADIAAILADHTLLLRAINDNFIGGVGFSTSGFIGSERAFVRI